MVHWDSGASAYKEFGFSGIRAKGVACEGSRDGELCAFARFDVAPVLSILRDSRAPISGWESLNVWRYPISCASTCSWQPPRPPRGALN